MEVNLLHFMWISYSLIVTFSGLTVLYSKHVPQVLVRLYSFGKLNKDEKRKSIFQLIEVPKSWFSHFYVFASTFIPLITSFVLDAYINGILNIFILYLLDNFGSIQRKGTVMPESVVILSCLISLQVLRRCYECFFISVYSDSKMNLSHYIVGMTFYFGVGLSLVHDAPGFERCTYESKDQKDLYPWFTPVNCFDESKDVYDLHQWFTPAHCFGSVMFLTAFLLQFETHKALAALRKSGDKVVSIGHYVPSSGFFEYVSCPHYFAEIIMYLSGCIILGGRSYTWWLVCLWTVSNQIMTGLLSHQWYQKTFKDYPKNRKAIIPFLL